MEADRAVRDLLEQMVSETDEIGLQVACYLGGELVVDAWAGLADEASGREVDGETLFTVFSCTKGVTSTAVHILADRGTLDYDAPITQYWPEFARNSKEGITVRDVITHRAGLPHMPEGVTPELMCDWDYMCKALAASSPIWPAGTKTGYHAYTFGWLLGEVVHRIDGRTFSVFVSEEITRPLGMIDLYLGVPAEAEPRVATLRNAAPSGGGAPGALMRLVVPPAVSLTGDIYNRPDVRRACLPAAGGIMNARSLARHYSGLGQLLSADRIRIASELQTDAVDEVLGRSSRKALGYMLGGPLSAQGSRFTSIGHTGAGGSIGFADPEHGFSFALTKNLLKGEQPGMSAANKIASVARAALGIPE